MPSWRRSIFRVRCAAFASVVAAACASEVSVAPDAANRVDASKAPRAPRCVQHFYDSDGAAAEPCDLGPSVERAAGAGALACGHAPVRGDEGVDRCAADALRLRRPFWVTSQLQGRDSEACRGFALAADGSAYEFLWDGDVRGGGGAGDPRLVRIPCASIELVMVDGRERLRCATVVGAEYVRVCGRE
ncbi:MAG: hypothetical protein JWM10_2580 [Myxococcaceae bacterium]|nr:hypothetical protein [Myxococcaceae bacterium]